MQYFCLDIGGTETRGALYAQDGTVRARATGPGGALSLGAAQAETSIRAVWQQITDALGSEAPPPGNTKLFAGIAGRGLPGATTELGERLGGFAQTHFVGDGYGALLAATEGKSGALISVGTGVTAQRLDADGNCLALSGWGFPAGDQGSGAWLGLWLTGALTKHLDGVTLAPPLPSELAKSVMAITGEETQQIMAWQTGAKPGAYASLAPLIVGHAAKGDAFCQHMLKSAASEIVGLARALYDGAEGDIHLSGGLSAILQPYCCEQAPAFGWEIGSIDPVAGIHLLATGQAPDEKLLPRPGFSALKTNEK